MPEIYLLLGSNQGNREFYLHQAHHKLENSVGKLLIKSKMYETAAWGLEKQAAFLNQVLKLTTNLSPENLLKAIHSIELNLGRERDIKWGPRVIDIDILFYDDLIVNFSDLIIPHPQLQNRRFTLIPLSEIAPELMHPVLKRSVKDLLVHCPDRLEVKLLS